MLNNFLLFYLDIIPDLPVQILSLKSPHCEINKVFLFFTFLSFRWNQMAIIEIYNPKKVKDGLSCVPSWANMLTCQLSVSPLHTPPCLIELQVYELFQRCDPMSLLHVNVMLITLKNVSPINAPTFLVVQQNKRMLLHHHKCRTLTWWPELLHSDIVHLHSQRLLKQTNCWICTSCGSQYWMATNIKI